MNLNDGFRSFRIFGSASTGPRFGSSLFVQASKIFTWWVEQLSCTRLWGYLQLISESFLCISSFCVIKIRPFSISEFLHIMIYMFGAVVLTTVNAIALATELILKAGIVWFEPERVVRIVRSRCYAYQRSKGYSRYVITRTICTVHYGIRAVISIKVLRGANTYEFTQMKRHTKKKGCLHDHLIGRSFRTFN